MNKVNKNLKRQVNVLVKWVSEKDELALEKLYNSTYKIIYSFLRRYTNNKEIIQDTISMTFITVIEKSTTKMFYVNCFSWILTISKFHLFNNLRKLNKECYIDANEEAKNLSYEYSSSHMDIEFAIDKLTEVEKQILYLKYHEDLTIVAIANILKLSTSTIKRELKIIYSRLKEELNDEEW